MISQFYLTGICICVNYDDFLSITLPQNINHFDKCVVITSENDEKTVQCIESIQNKKIELLKTNVFYSNGAAFNKGAAIRQAQKALMNQNPINKNKWICIIDSDIVLPNDFRDICEKKCVDKNALYGAKRLNYSTYTDYIENEPSNEIDNNEVGVGFLQIYHQNTQNTKFYSTMFKTASSCDTEFRNKWGKSITDLGILVKHLGQSCTNWKGRVTQKFN